MKNKVSLKVIEVPIIEMTGTIVTTSRETALQLEPWVDLPDGETLRLIYGGEIENNDDRLMFGVVKADGMVDCFTLEFEDQWRWFGEYYGYPECCVEEFCSIGEGPFNSNQFTGTGYVPCRHCVTTSCPTDLVKLIGERRVSTIPFLLDVSELEENFQLVTYLIKRQG